MKRVHLLRVEGPPADFAPLVAALAEDGGRAGWLELEATTPVAESLGAAADVGVLRSVAVTGDRTIAVKPLRGRPVLGDLLREHFRGCRVVLVRGEVEAPSVEPDGDRWVVRTGDRERSFDAPSLAAALRRPRPWE